MSLRDYKDAEKLAHKHGVEAFIMAILRKGDLAYSAPLAKAFPSVLKEFTARYNAPGGKLPGDK